jgi:hypothetical protein
LVYRIIVGLTKEGAYEQDIPVNKFLQEFQKKGDAP